MPDPASAKKQLKLLWLACGKKDNLIRISQGVHAYLKDKAIPHVWHVDGNAHDATEWRNNLYLFSQRNLPLIVHQTGNAIWQGCPLRPSRR